MEPKIVRREQVYLIGFSFFGDPFAASGGWTEENEIGRLWTRFLAYLEQHGSKLPSTACRDTSYELHIEHDETPEKGHYEVFVGIRSPTLEDLPPQLSIKVLPAGEYAAVTLRGPEITSDWAQRIYQEWLPEAGYVQAHGFMFELYDQRFKGLDRLEDSEIDIYVPVCPLH
jgi:predicted transcriptional regulator YdeE